MLEPASVPPSSTNDGRSDATLPPQEQQPQQQQRRLAHNLSDATILRSQDVQLTQDVTFDSLLLAPETCMGLKDCGFQRPSPIQLDTIPLGRCGFDLVVQAKAGTGKTCVFAVIALEALQSNPNNCTQTLIIAPTREIAIQIHDVISQIGRAYKQLKCGLCIGGYRLGQDISTLSKACQIIVGTPGRINHLIKDEKLKTSQIELFVLDEADKLMDEQFKAQIDSIYKSLPSDKQMIATSATYPDELSKFLQKYMRDSKSVRLGTELYLEAVEQFYVQSKPGGSPKEDLAKKTETLKAIIDKEKFTKCIIFTNFQTRAPIICKNLNKDETFTQKHGNVKYICAELDQSERKDIFNKFRNSDAHKILVSTDVSARGIDIHDIEVVINYDVPDEGVKYCHRIGRSGRFGKPGRAITIVTHGEEQSSEHDNNRRGDLSILMKIVKDNDRIKKLDLEVP